MKRFGRLWPEVVSFNNLLSAYLKARKGKQSVPSVAEFTLNLETELLTPLCHFKNKIFIYQSVTHSYGTTFVVPYEFITSCFPANSSVEVTNLG
jgi:hypothetical protein